MIEYSSIERIVVNFPTSFVFSKQFKNQLEVVVYDFSFIVAENDKQKDDLLTKFNLLYRVLNYLFFYLEFTLVYKI